jgi:hypothetical protein
MAFVAAVYMNATARHAKDLLCVTALQATHGPNCNYEEQ